MFDIDTANGLTAPVLEPHAPAAVFLVCGSWAVLFLPYSHCDIDF